MQICLYVRFCCITMIEEIYFLEQNCKCVVRETWKILLCYYEYCWWLKTNINSKRWRIGNKRTCIFTVYTEFTRISLEMKLLSQFFLRLNECIWVYRWKCTFVIVIHEDNFDNILTNLWLYYAEKFDRCLGIIILF